MEKEKIARINELAKKSKETGLTEEEAENFFPLYFELQNKKKESNKATWKKAGKGMKQETPESEYKEIIDDFFESQQQNLDMEKEYIEKYRKVLSDKKIYMIYSLWFYKTHGYLRGQFNRNMLKILQEMEEK